MEDKKTTKEDRLKFKDFNFFKDSFMANIDTVINSNFLSKIDKGEMPFNKDDLIEYLDAKQPFRRKVDDFLDKISEPENQEGNSTPTDKDKEKADAGSRLFNYFLSMNLQDLASYVSSNFDNNYVEAFHHAENNVKLWEGLHIKASEDVNKEDIQFQSFLNLARRGILYNLSETIFYLESTLLHRGFSFMRNYLKGDKTNRYVKKIINNLIAYYQETTNNIPYAFFSIYNLQSRINYEINSLKDAVNEGSIKISQKQWDQVISYFNDLLLRLVVIAITVRYQILMSNTKLIPIYNDFFLSGNTARRVFLTTGGFFKVTKKDDGTYERDLYPFSIDKTHKEDSVEGIQTNIKNWLTNEINSFKDNRDPNASEDAVFFWPGVGMNFPTNTQFILTFNGLFPTLHIKSRRKLKGYAVQTVVTSTKKAKDAEANASNHEPDTSSHSRLPLSESADFHQQVYLEEYPWAVNMIFHEDLVVDLQDHNEDRPDLNVDNAPRIGANERNLTINKQSISNRHNPDFQQLSMKVNAKAEDCEIIVKIPYIPPSFDALLNIKFEGGSDEIILTTG
ncbi:MAG TPA: hypothetical protein DCR93_34435 [Cytophagales bacterium]|nr:hypothetical protein [Cytophagales bacterium]HAP64369.1 hypothetical protein [Cytophagales bacterium]